MRFNDLRVFVQSISTPEEPVRRAYCTLQMWKGTSTTLNSFVTELVLKYFLGGKSLCLILILCLIPVSEFNFLANGGCDSIFTDGSVEVPRSVGFE